MSQTWSPVSCVHRHVADYYARLFCTQWPELAARCNGRIARAIQICSCPGACRRGDHPDVFKVDSDSDSRHFHLVNIKSRSCTCKDHRENSTRPAGDQIICKHRLAIGFHLFGPDWAYKSHVDLVLHRPKQQTRAQMSDALADAWSAANSAATAVERFRPEDYDQPASVAARELMYQLTDLATKAQTEFNNFSRSK